MESETKEFVQLVRLYAVKEKELPYGKKELNDSAKVVELSRQILKNQDREYILAIAMDARMNWKDCWEKQCCSGNVRDS